MIKETSFVVRIAYWLLLTFLIGSCVNGSAETSTVTPESTVTSEPVVEYLEEVVPPCLIDDSGWDPCVAETPRQTRAATISAAPPSWPYVEGVLSFREILLRDSRSARAHIVVRGIPQTDSTRCAAYPVGIANYKLKTMRLPLSYFEDDFHYHCFVDVKINEYIIGVGPPVLSVSMLRENLQRNMLDENKEVLEYFVPLLRNPEDRVASIYEGKEMILFLTLPTSLTIESWLTFGIFDRWFVQRTSDGIRAIAQDIELAINDQQRNRLNRPLDQLLQEVKEAAEYRFTITGGRLDADPTLPFFVTDANRLRDFYVSAGAVYDDTERATRPPPPVPGEDDPSAPTLPVNDGTTETTIPVPGEEGTAPPATDDAGLSVGQTSTTTTETTTTTSTTTTTLVSSTTEVIPADTTTTTSSVTETVTGTTTTTTTEAPNGENAPPLADDITDEEEQTTTTTTFAVTETTTTTTEAPNEENGPPPADDITGGEEQATTTTTAPPASGDIPADTTDIPLPSDDDPAPPANEEEPADDPGTGELPTDGAGA